MFECKSKCQDIKKIKIVRRSKSSEDQSIDDCVDVIWDKTSYRKLAERDQWPGMDMSGHEREEGHSSIMTCQHVNKDCLILSQNICTSAPHCLSHGIWCHIVESFWFVSNLSNFNIIYIVAPCHECMLLNAETSLSLHSLLGCLYEIKLMFILINTF